MELLEKIQAKSALEILPEEPSDDNPDKCVIVFRFPDGEKVVQRKFLKTDKITNLYLHIKSFGREIPKRMIGYFTEFLFGAWAVYNKKKITFGKLKFVR